MRTILITILCFVFAFANNERVTFESVVERYKKQEEFVSSLDQGTITFEDYNKHAAIEAYIRGLNTNPVATVEEIEKTSNYESILMLNICKDECGTKPKIFIECGIHAREWIAPAVCLYIIQELVENPSKNEENAALIQNVDWHIVPLLNVDGYKHTHEEPKNRLWSKTRGKSGNSCVGVDANRNFNFHWNITTSQCSETYSGKESASEPEVKAIESIVTKLNAEKGIKLYLAMHSYGQYILHPWSYTETLPKEVGKLMDVGMRVAQVIKEYSGTRYVVSSFHDALYQAYGTSIDFAFGRLEIKLAYNIQLPGGGVAGFDLPPEQIIPVAKETFEGIKEFHKIIEELYGPK